MKEIALEVAGDMLAETQAVVTAASHLIEGGAVPFGDPLADQVNGIRTRLQIPAPGRDGVHVRALCPDEAQRLAAAAELVVGASSEEGRLWRMAVRVLTLASGAGSPA